MGRIVAHVTVANALDPKLQIRFDALVDTGATLLARIIHQESREVSGPNCQLPMVEGALGTPSIPVARSPSAIGHWPLDIPRLFAKVFANNLG